MFTYADFKIHPTINLILVPFSLCYHVIWHILEMVNYPVEFKGEYGDRIMTNLEVTSSRDLQLDLDAVNKI